jgi:hypothetical protein
MNDRKISVTLTGPAKIGGKREPEGSTVEVSTALALQLAASGVINPHHVAETAMLSGEMDEAVRQAVTERETLWGTALEHFKTMAEDDALARISGIESQRDAALQRVTSLEDAAKADASRISSLETEVAELTAAKSKVEAKSSEKKA